MTNQQPSLSLDALRRAATRLKKAFAAGDPDARQRVAAALPAPKEALKHADFLHVIAREHYFQSWPKLVAAAGLQGLDRAARQARMRAALYHGQVYVAERILEETPDIAEGDLGLACALYDVDRVRAWLEQDSGAATRPSGPRNPILHLAFSRWIKARPALEPAMLAVAEALVAAGADVNDGFLFAQGDDHRLPALYGAIGHADNMVLGRWLLDHGANPDDAESLYHATELGHHEGLGLLIAHGANPKGTNALLRAMDFNDHTAVRMLLAAGADPDDFNPEEVGGEAPWVIPALHQAGRRGCDAKMVEILLEAGADTTRLWKGASAYAFATAYGNEPVAQALLGAGARTDISPAEAQLAAAAGGQTPAGHVDEAALLDAYDGLLRNVVSIPDRLPHIKGLIGIGFDPDRPDHDGITPVQIAGWEGLPEHMAYLLTLNPDLGHVNAYGGGLISTILHGSENAQNRESRDHIGCLQLALDAGVRLQRREIEGAGREEVAAFLTEWAAEHPDRVI